LSKTPSVSLKMLAIPWVLLRFLPNAERFILHD
jgi:hypothetical protein